MSDTLFQYYEQELQFFRRQGQEFAARHPAAAGRLQLEANRSVDPHVERLIESFAFLTSRIQKKLDDDFPEITDALLNVLYPHYLAPIPSLAMVQLVPEPANLQPTGLAVPRHSRMHTNQIDGVACQYRTCYDVNLWPVEVIEAEAIAPPFPATVKAPPGTQSAIRLRLRCQADLSFDQLALESLRFHLAGDARLGAVIFELLFNHVQTIEFRSLGKQDDAQPIRLDAKSCLSPVGFAANEGLLPYGPESFQGYRLLTELFAFGEKFLFFDLSGFQQVAAAKMGRTIDVLFYLDRPLTGLEHAFAPATFALGCTPVVNLFERIAEPIQLDHRTNQYRVAADYRRPGAYEVYSIDEVYTADSLDPKVYRKFYDYRHHAPWGVQQEGSAFWYASRHESHRPDDHGTEVYLHPVDLDFNPAADDDETLVVKTLCTNRDLPIRLQHAGERLRFELEAAVPLRGIRCLRTPTTPLRPSRRRGAQWRLVSHLALNHLSITSSPDSTSALREMLRLYDFSDRDNAHHLAACNSQWIDGITSVKSRRVTGRLNGLAEGGICRGVEIAIDFDEEKFNGTEFVFASVIERFLALYASLNSFVQFVATTDNGTTLLKRWSPRAGETPLG